MRSRRGFTLVELILVMIVIFAVAAVVGPRYTDFFPSFQLKKSTEHLLAWARKARADAATTGTRQRLMLDIDHRKYWIENEPRPIKDPGTFVPLGGSWGEETFPDPVRFDSIKGAETDSANAGIRYVEFRPDGTSTDATVILVNEAGEQQTLRIVGTSSKITIETKEQQP